MLECRLSGEKGITLVSSKRTTPSSGFSKPAIMRSKVVFPHPEGPSREKNSPAFITKLMSDNAMKSPKRFETWSIET